MYFGTCARCASRSACDIVGSEFRLAVCATGRSSLRRQARRYKSESQENVFDTEFINSCNDVYGKTWATDAMINVRGRDRLLIPPCNAYFLTGH